MELMAIRHLAFWQIYIHKFKQRRSQVYEPAQCCLSSGIDFFGIMKDQRNSC